jgi:hypothetical protein
VCVCVCVRERESLYIPRKVDASAATRRRHTSCGRLRAGLLHTLHMRVCVCVCVCACFQRVVFSTCEDGGRCVCAGRMARYMHSATVCVCTPIRGYACSSHTHAKTRHGNAIQLTHTHISTVCTCVCVYIYHKAAWICIQITHTHTLQLCERE